MHRPQRARRNNKDCTTTHAHTPHHFPAYLSSAEDPRHCTAPIERVKLIIQTQDANPKIKSGEIPRYTGISNCFTRVYSEQGLKAFWRGNTTNIIRYFPTQAFNFAFKDTIKGLFPKVEDYGVDTILDLHVKRQRVDTVV